MDSPVYSFGEVQAVHAPPSSLHLNEELSEEEKAKLAVLLFTVPDGPELMVVVDDGLYSAGSWSCHDADLATFW